MISYVQITKMRIEPELLSLVSKATQQIAERYVSMHPCLNVYKSFKCLLLDMHYGSLITGLEIALAWKPFDLTVLWEVCTVICQKVEDRMISV